MLVITKMRTFASAVLTGAALIASCTALALASGPAAAETIDQVKQKGELTVGMLVDFPPYGILNAKNQPDGYDADVAKQLAKDLGVKVNIVSVTGPNRIPFLLTNKVDLLVASLAITPGARQAGPVFPALFSRPDRRVRRQGPDHRQA